MDLEKSAPSKTYPTLSFVHINNPEETKLRSKKRAVRSHVAYYQHHKDDEKNRASVARTPRLRRRVKPEPKPEPEVELTAPAFPVSQSTTCSTNSPPISVKSETKATHTGPRSRRGSFPLSDLLQGTGLDPFQTYPVPWNHVYNPILAFYISHICLDLPEPFSGKEERLFFRLRTVWFPFVLQSPKLFYAAMSLSCAIYHSRRKQVIHKVALFDLRLNAISAINDSLADPKLRTDDFTIASVFCMSCAESLLGDTAAYAVHMAGLARMVQLRGGLENMALDGLLERMILWLDYNHATNHGSTLYFDRSTEVSTRASPYKYDELQLPPVSQETAQTDAPHATISDSYSSPRPAGSGLEPSPESTGSGNSGEMIDGHTEDIDFRGLPETLSPDSGINMDNADL